MLKNERGNSLLVVMLMSLIFTTLGLSIIASTINSSKRVETRESDIEKTYQGIKVVDSMISDLSSKLKTLPLTSFDKNSIGYSFFDSKLEDLLREELIYKNEANEDFHSFIECLNIVNLSGSSAEFIDKSSDRACLDTSALDKYKTENLDTNKDFTRVLEIVLVTRNPAENEGSFRRTIRKRIILSPLPSFLKYAVGSVKSEEGNGLFLNGSPNVVGNTYANALNIKDDAEYVNSDNYLKTIKAPLPSLHGDIFSSDSQVISMLKPVNFYKQKVPPLKHDSQFIDIKFDDTFDEQAVGLLNRSLGITLDNNISITVKDHVSQLLQNKIPDSQAPNTNVEEPFSLVKNQDNPVSQTEPDLIDSYKLESISGPITLSNAVYNIPGNLVINSLNYPINIHGDLTVNGDLYIATGHEINLTKNIYVNGNIYLLGFGGNLTIGNQHSENTSIYSLKDINIYSDGVSGSFNFYSKFVSGNSITNNTEGTSVKFNEYIIAGDNIDIKSMGDNNTARNLGINSDTLSGGDIKLTSLNNTIQVQGDIISSGSFYLNGDGQDTMMEDDIFMFDSVVYANKEGYISNVNILGAENNEKQLVLLTKEKLTITRINEFNNFSNLNEQVGINVPNDINIQPLKAFFYTDSEAELYGVGSLFYIHGGIFAKEKLVINSIRGKMDGVNDLNGVLNNQEDKYSRFNVVYNRKVLLSKINSLPMVEYLQIFPDEMIIE